METVDLSTLEPLKVKALSLLNRIEDELDHPEIWNEIASESKQLPFLHKYFLSLLSISQTDTVRKLLFVLEAFCSALYKDLIEGKNKLQSLMQAYPNSLLIHGAYRFIEDHTKNKSTQVNLDPLLHFIDVQAKTNTVLISQLQNIQLSLRESEIILSQKIHHLQQSVHLINRNLINKITRKIKCVFIVSFYQAWNTLSCVYEEMLKTDDFEPIVISTSRKRHPETNTIFGEEDVHNYLTQQGIQHIRLDTSKSEHNAIDILKAIGPDIIFRQTAWHDLPPILNTEEINFARLCYIPYSYSAVKRISNKEPINAKCSIYHTDLYYHRLCWKIFCESDIHKSMYIENSVRAGNNVVVTGYPKFDKLLAEKDRAGIWPIVNNLSHNRFKIIWAPHHSLREDVMGFGTFLKVHQEMLSWAKESQNDFEFVLKPHPGLIGEIVHTSKALTQEYMDNYLAEWNALPNTAYYDGGDYSPLFISSDVMLTDGVAFLSEYQLFEKPIIFIDSQKNCGFNAAGNMMMQSVNKITTIAEAKVLCEKLKNGEPNPLKELQKQVITYLAPYPGQSARNIINAIREGLIEENVI